MYVVNCTDDTGFKCKPGPTYLYTIRDTNTWYLKIGISKDPEGRRTRLQCGNPNRIDLESIEGPFSLSAARFYEKALHKYFKRKHVRGEWYKISGYILQKRLGKIHNDNSNLH